MITSATLGTVSGNLIRSYFTAFFAVLYILSIAPVALADPPEVRTVEVEGQADQAEIRIEGVFDVPDYALRTRLEGRVVIIDVVGATLPDSGVQQSGSTRLVSGLTASSTARGVRIEVRLARPVPYRASATPGSIVVELAPSAGPTLPTPSERAPVIEAVHLERRDGRDRVIVDLTRAAAFRVVPGAEGNERLEIRDARIASNVQRQLRGRSGSTVQNVTLSQQEGRAVLTVQRAGDGRATAIREGDHIVWLFSPTVRTGQRRSRTIAREDAVEFEEISGGMDIAEAASFLTDVPLQVSAARGNRRFRGRRIDLDFNNADIHDILRLLADVGRVNVVTSDDVSGNVTIRMRNVPWDHALNVVLQAKGLGMVRRGNLIRVAPLETLERERESAIARAKQREQLAPLETRLVPVSYATAEELSARISELLSSRGNVSVDTRTNMLIVRDITENLDDAEALVRTLDTQTPQVLVEARIVEATSQYIRDVGIQWGGDVTASTATGNPTGLAFPNSIGVAGGAYDGDTPTAGLSPFQSTVDPSNFAVNLPAITGTGAGGALGLALGSIGGNVNLNVRLSAAESNGVVRIVSSPRILTLDNHEAHIAQGTLIPYSQVSAQGVQTAFQEAKLELRVRPHVTSDGSVSMHVQVTRDEPDFGRTSARGDPTILKREAETDLLIEDGHTAVIGGIYTRNTGRTINQVPFFGDIPILGLLFQRRQLRDERNELLIFLTPRIVNREQAFLD